jgi:hypothetical protein
MSLGKTTIFVLEMGYKLFALDIIERDELNLTKGRNLREAM